MIRKLTLLVFICTSLTLAGQVPMNNPGNAPADGTLQGKIINGENNQPVEYASIALFSVRDSALVGGTISGPDGSFGLTNIPFGKYYLEISFVGFKKSRLDNIMITPAQRNVQLGSLKMDESAHSLEEVEIVGNQHHMEYKIDRKVITVSQDIVSAGGTAVDVLENTPSVTTDMDGNVQLRGSGNFTVLIDGKPSVLDGTEALQQMPASTIQSIEIITNPSAKYDPDGVAGIINVITRKSKITGVSGIINVSAATQKQNNLDFLVNYKTGDFNFFVGGDFMDFENPGKMKSYRESYSALDTFFMSTHAEGRMKRKGFNVKGGFDFNPDPSNSLSFGLNYGDRSFGRLTDGRNTQYIGSLNPRTYYLETSGFERSNRYYETNLFYQHNFGSPNHYISGSANFSYEEGGENNPFSKSYTDSFWNLIPDSALVKNRTLEDGTEQDLRLKLDYTRTFSEKSKLEAGYQGRMELENNDFLYQTFEPDQKLWLTDELQSNSNEFLNNIHALYSIYSNSLKWFDYQVGLRAEYTDRNIKQLITDKEYPIQRWDLFPSVHLSKSFTGDQQLQLSYSRRVNRPRGWDLDPFPQYMNEYTVRMGNPALEPEFINSYELNYQKKVGPAMLSAEGYFRQTTNMISRIMKPDDEILGRFIMTSENFNKSEATGIELMLNSPITKWWQINASGTVYHYRLDGEVLNSDAVESTVTWNTRINSNIRIKGNTRIQFMAFYNAPGITPQGKEGDFFMTSAGIRQDFFKKKLNATLQVRDIFQTMKHSFSSYGSNFYSSMEFRRKGPVVSLTLSYKINNFKESRRNPSDDNEESGGMDMM